MHNLAYRILLIVCFSLSTFAHAATPDTQKDPTDDPLLYRLILYTNSISREPHKTISFRMYGKGPEVFAKADIKLNNMGYFSHNDYSYERKSPSTYRILVIGGEQTASSISDTSWPDMLEKILNEKKILPGKTFEVINIAWPDARFPHYATYWEIEGKKFNPDLVLLNVVETDYPVYINSASIATYKGKPYGGQPVSYKVGPEKFDLITASIACVDNPNEPSISNPDCIPGIPFNFKVDPNILDNLNKIQMLQQAVIKDFIAGGVDRKLDVIDTPQAKQEIDFVQYAAENLNKIIKDAPDSLVIHNFNYWELLQNLDYSYSNELMARFPTFNIVDMRQFAPTRNPEVLDTWFIPAMREKWTVKGHEVYANLVADRIVERLLPLEKADPGFFRTILYTEAITRLPHKEISFAMFGKDAEVLVKADLKLNNLGYISKNNYQYDKKNQEEYRILVLGGEQTASSTTDISWPDILEQELNATKSKRKFKVINIGWPDARFPELASDFLDVGVRFSPDLVLFNIVETDYLVTMIGNFTIMYKGVNPLGCEFRYFLDLEKSPDYTAQTGVQCITRENTSFSNPDCMLGIPFGFKVSKPFIKDKSRIRKLQNMAVRDFIAGGTKRQFDPVDAPEVKDKPDFVGIAAENLRKITRKSKNVIFMHNFNYLELLQNIPFTYTEELQRRFPEFSVIDMRSFVKDYTPESAAKWYIPVMLEKWTVEGHNLYAKLVAGVVRNHLSTVK